MRVKITRNKHKGEMNASYYRMRVPAPFRFQLAKMVMENCGTDVTAVVDTNMAPDVQPDERIEAALKEAGIDFTVWPVKEEPGRVFGIPANMIRRKKPKMLRLYVMDLTGATLTEAVFDGFFRYFDLALGLGRQVPFVQIRDKLELDSLDSVLFNPEYFADSYYDSVVCTTMRSTFDIESYIRSIQK